jgi:phosphate starvation-inducible PhoH-like protein
MKEPNRNRKNEIKYNVTLNEEQKTAKQLILDNQIVIVTGRAGSGKSLVGAVTALDFLNKGMCDKILVARSAIEVGKSLGFLPGDLKEKFNPYMEALVENLYKCTDRLKIDDFIKKGEIQALPVQFIRGKTIDDILIVEEAQNLTAKEMEAILTRLGTTGKIVINGDSSQRDINVEKEDGGKTGLDFAIELSKNIDGIEHIKLKENHRSGLVGKILDYVYGK